MRGRDERGSILVTVLLLSAVLGVIGATLVRDAVADLGQTSRVVEHNRSYQAAEAGIDDYIAKLTEDHSYYDHYTHPAESTRTSGSVVVAAGTSWTGGVTWQYLHGHDAWRKIGDDVEYNLEVEGPTNLRQTVRIVATGRRTNGDGRTTTVEAFVRPASVADFQMIANRSITYGENAKTYGKIYAGIEVRQNADGSTTEISHTVTHGGDAYADIHAEGLVVPTYTKVVDGVSTTYHLELLEGAQRYDSTPLPGMTTPGIRTVIHNRIDFNKFTGSLGDVQRVAAAGGPNQVFDDPTYDAWWLTFASDGTYSARGCDRVFIDKLVGTPLVMTTVLAELGEALPACGPAVERTVPTNGAVWVAQNAIISGKVRGRLTVASPYDIVVGGNLTYETPGIDVLGLIAGVNMMVPKWGPTDLTWSAATLNIKGEWRSWDTSGDLGKLTFTGSTATGGIAYMNLYKTRSYEYDRNLLFLQPPYFPVLEEAYTVVLQREITPDG